MYLSSINLRLIMVASFAEAWIEISLLLVVLLVD